jgi:hypothetical protein
MFQPCKSPPGPPPGSVPCVDPAPLGRRVLALVIDWGASMGVVLLILGPGAYIAGDAAFPILAVFFVEIVLFTWILSGSFGQIITRLAVVRYAGGGRLALWRIALRTLLICLVIPAVVMDKQGRGLQDRAVDSIVIRRP